MAYTKEEEEKLREYPTLSVEELSQELGKPKRSIIAKLAKMGVYRKLEKTTKTGAPLISKAELVAQIEEALGAEFPTLAKAGKEDLRKLAELV